MTIIFMIIFDTNLSICNRLIQIYIPAISIPNDKILKKKKEIISFITIVLLRYFWGAATTLSGAALRGAAVDTGAEYAGQKAKNAANNVHMKVFLITFFI